MARAWIRRLISGSEDGVRRRPSGREVGQLGAGVFWRFHDATARTVPTVQLPPPVRILRSQPYLSGILDQRAEIRAGELLAEMKERGERQTGHNEQNLRGSHVATLVAPKLSDLDEPRKRGLGGAVRCRTDACYQPSLTLQPSRTLRWTKEKTSKDQAFSEFVANAAHARAGHYRERAEQLRGMAEARAVARQPAEPC